MSKSIDYVRSVWRVVLLGLIVVAAGYTTPVQAATLYASPASTQVSVGNIASIKVLVATDGKVINNVEGTLQYPSDILEIVSVSKEGTIFPLWVEEPKFSNQEGQLTFNGGVPDPGYTGQLGNILTITFRTKKSGTASVIFGESAVRANDGLGTDILSAKQSATFTVSAPQIVPEVIPVAPVAPVVQTVSDASAPLVTSTSHPDQTSWYNVKDAEVSWEVPNDVVAVSTFMSRNAGTPTVVYDPPIANKRVANLEDGVWYFNVRFKNQKGWGAIAHYKIQVDTTAPNPFKITFSQSSQLDDVRPVAHFTTTDTASGVAYYEVKIDNGQFTKVSSRDAAAYVIDNQEPGKHLLFVRAVDGARNVTMQSAEFIAASIDAPRITSYPREVRKDESIVIKGTSNFGTNVEVLLTDSFGHAASMMVPTQNDGTFTAQWSQHIEGGFHTLSARAIDMKGIKSEYTEGVTLIVDQSLMEVIVTFILNWLSVIVLVGGVCFAGAWSIVYLVHQNHAIRKGVHRDVRNAESAIHQAFDILRENVQSQIKLLDKARTKRALTKEEEKIAKQLSTNLTKAEKYIAEKLIDIEDKV